MKLIKKVAPGRLARAILALASASGNRSIEVIPKQTEGRDDGSESKSQIDGVMQLTECTTITVETERLLIVRAERRSSR